MKLIVALAASALMIVASWRGWFPSSLTETLGFVTGAWCVYLVVVQNIWTFPLGIANNVFFFVLFLEARLFGDAWLQVVYAILAVHGWYTWLRGGANRSERRVAHASPIQLGITAIGVIVGTAALTAALQAAAGASPLLDAFTTVLSLAAQILLNLKFIENWYLWIAADVIYIYLYVARGLPLTSVLYFVFLCLCIAGVVEWRRALAAGALGPAASEA